MNIIKGDLIKLALAGKFDAIIHGANCFTTMGAGIAKAIRSEFPEAYAIDQKTVKGDRNKLGTYSSATVKRNNHIIIVVNAYTQYNYRGPGVKADYEAIQKVFKKIGQNFADKRIGYPKIGAGLAGGDWDKISAIIDTELEGCDHTLVEF